MQLLTVSCEQKAHVVPHFYFLDLLNVITLFTMPWTSGHANDITWPKVMLHLILIVLSWQMLWCHWGYCWHHMTPTLVSMVSDDQRSHVTPFEHLDWRNAIESLFIPLKSCVTNACTNVFHFQIILDYDLSILT